jgi:hypothetical protein
MMAEKRALPAAVFFADDPRAVNVARVVPGGAEVRRIRECVLGYSKAPITGPSALQQANQKFTLTEMTGRCYRKVLRALVQLRKEDGVIIEDYAAWMTVAADIAAAIFGPTVTAHNVEGQCLFMGFEFDRAAIPSFHVRAAQWCQAQDYAPLSGDEVGRLVKLTWRERDALIERKASGVTRIGSFDETSVERRRRKDRERKAGQRACARSPKQPKVWEALGMKRSTYYHQRRAWTDSVHFSYKEGNADKNSPTPGKADRISPTFGPSDHGRAIPMGNADKNSPTAAKGGRK